MKTGLFIGRFQPFHHAHLSDVEHALSCVDKLFIGIGSSQESGTDNNPYTFEQRKDMIDRVLHAHQKHYEIFPIEDVGDDEKWVDLIEQKIGTVNTVFTGNDWTEECFVKKGYAVHKIELIDGINATLIRQLMKEKKEWKHLVPKDVVEYLENLS